MGNKAIAALAFAALIFAVMKAVFQFLRWFYRESDSVYRKHIESIVETLKQQTLFEMAHGILVRLINRVESIIAFKDNSDGVRSKGGNQSLSTIQFIIIFAAAAIVLNAAIFVAASTFAIASHFENVEETIAAILSALEGEGGYSRFLGMNTLVSILGAGFDILSLTATWMLISHAATARTATSLAGHLLLDLIIAVIACMWAYVILSLTLNRYYDILLPAVIYFSNGNPELYMLNTLGATLNVNPPVWYIVVFLGISAALPTIAYIIALLPVFALRLTPKWVANILTRLLSQLANDDAPIMKQLETFVSSSGAVIAATIAWLRT